MNADDPRHGTEAGCREHYRHNQKPCAPCLEAHRRNNIMRQLYPHKRPAIGSKRRIRALQAIGYGRDRIAAELGYTDGGALTNLLRDDRETVLNGTHDRIAAVYERLCMTLPIGPGPARARTWAKRAGYAPPLAWDDIDNDAGPYREQPSRPDEVDLNVVERILAGEWRLTASRAERFAVVDVWTGTDNELERLTGWNIARMRREMKAVA